MKCFPQPLCGTDGPGNVPSPSGRPGGRRRFHRSFPRPSCGAGSAFTVAPLWGWAFIGGGDYLSLAATPCFGPPWADLVHSSSSSSVSSDSSYNDSGTSELTDVARRSRSGGCRGRGVEGYPPSLPPSGRPAMPPPRVVRPSFGSPPAPLVSEGVGLAWRQAARGCITATPQFHEPGFAVTGSAPTRSLASGHHVRKRLRQQRVAGPALVEVLPDGLALCSWNGSHTEERFTFILRDVTVVTSACCGHPITVMFEYEYRSFHPRLHTTGRQFVRRPLSPTLYRRSKRGTIRRR